MRIFDRRRRFFDRGRPRQPLLWIDRQNGIGGYWATQILPFGDPVSFTGSMDFETAVYRSSEARKAA